MSEKEKSNSVLEEIKEIYTFLTEAEPTPDDEIENREKFIKLFHNLKNFSTYIDHKDLIDTILNKLEEWDTLELWFLETSIPNDIQTLLNIPQKKEPDLKKTEEQLKVKTEPVIEKTEIDLTQIVNKVSEQFKGEIEGLKGKIENLKKELEKKDQTLQSMSQKKKIQKITLSKESKLPPPKIKIPVIKKSKPTPQINIKPDTIQKVDLKPIQLEPRKSDKNIVDKQLIPIPDDSVEKESEDQIKELTPILNKEPQFGPVIREFEDVPIITEKRRITPIVLEEESGKEGKGQEKQSIVFSVEKPKINSMKIEEIETESMKSSATDLFNVFSSVGGKSSETKEKKTAIKEPKKNIENNKGETTSFINFNQSKPIIKNKEIIEHEKELPTDKDSLYQELIALEGRRYSLERDFKELDANLKKGSISDVQYNNQSDILKNNLDNITSRINKIRRIISSL